MYIHPGNGRIIFHLIKINQQMIKIIRTDSSNADFQSLVALLDADLKIRDGEDHSFYSQFNTIESIKHVVVAFVENKAIACGAFKHFSEKYPCPTP